MLKLRPFAGKPRKPEIQIHRLFVKLVSVLDEADNVIDAHRNNHDWLTRRGLVSGDFALLESEAAAKAKLDAISEWLMGDIHFAIRSTVLGARKKLAVYNSGRAWWRGAKRADLPRTPDGTIIYLEKDLDIELIVVKEVAVYGQPELVNLKIEPTERGRARIDLLEEECREIERQFADPNKAAYWADLIADLEQKLKEAKASRDALLSKWSGDGSGQLTRHPANP